MAETYIFETANFQVFLGASHSYLVATASSGQPFRVFDFTFSCDATSTGLMKIEFLVGTLTGGTTSTAPNKARMNGESWNNAPITTSSSYSVEPTYTKHASNDSLVVKTTSLLLPSTPYEIEYPLGREFYCPASNLFAVRLTPTTDAPLAYLSLGIEE